MSNLQQPVVTESAYLTLHYRLATLEGADIISTFGNNPATVQLGTGQLAPFLEACLIGMPEGGQQRFELPPEKAFGLRNPDLLRRVSRKTLVRHSEQEEDYKVGDMVEFSAPDGKRFAGVLREISGDETWLDFNHPLAGHTLKFEAKIIGVM
jgi:FKBP-type peptidyl-prolyl cis-trans isomerase SlpA